MLICGLFRAAGPSPLPTLEEPGWRSSLFQEGIIPLMRRQEIAHTHTHSWSVFCGGSDAIEPAGYLYIHLGNSSLSNAVTSRRGLSPGDRLHHSTEWTIQRRTQLTLQGRQLILMPTILARQSPIGTKIWSLQLSVLRTRFLVREEQVSLVAQNER
jgi:hypothetical protein